MEFNYFETLINMVNSKKASKYLHFLMFLYDFPFISIMPMDDNRRKDGLCLRQRLGFSDLSDCSWLEMLIALAERCEAEMADVGENRTWFWFWLIIDYMFSVPVNDVHFDEETVKMTLNGIQEHRISINSNRPELAKEEIWTQAMALLNEYIEKMS